MKLYGLASGRDQDVHVVDSFEHTIICSLMQLRRQEYDWSPHALKLIDGLAAGKAGMDSQMGDSSDFVGWLWKDLSKFWTPQLERSRYCRDPMNAEERLRTF